MLKTMLLVNLNVCMFGVTRFLIYDTYVCKIMTGTVNAEHMINIVIAVIYFSNLHKSCFCNIDVSYISSSVIDSNYIHLQLIFTLIITILNALSETFSTMKQVLFNCNVSLHNDYISYYQFIHCYLWTISHSSTAFQSISGFDLMICRIIDVIKCKFKEINNKYNQNKTHIDRRVQSDDRMHWVSINDILILITDILSIYSVYIMISHLLIEKQALIHVFDTIIIVLVVYYQLSSHECENLNDVTDKTNGDIDMDYMVDWSIITIFNGLWCCLRIFINCVVIGCNSDDYKSYYLSLSYSTMVYLSITMTELIFYDVNHWIKQYFSEFNDKLGAYNSENGAKCQ